MSHIWSLKVPTGYEPHLVFDTMTIKRKYFKGNFIDNISRIERTCSKGNFIDSTFKGNFIDNISRIERKRSKGNFIDSTFKGKGFLLIIPLKMHRISHLRH